MFAQERLNIIKSYLRERGKLDVHGISVMLGVSEVTIRRDLEKLEAEGFLRRTHGGALLAGPEEAALADAPVDPEQGARDDLARVASWLVEDQDVVFLVDSPACTAMVPCLRARTGLTVLTNSLAIAREVSNQSGNRVVLLGGNLDPVSQAVYGNLAQQNLRKFHVRRMFVEADGISEELLVTLGSEAKADLVHEALDCADELVLLCPASRFARKSFYRLGPVSLARCLVTNPCLDDLYKTRLFASGLQLFTTVNAFEVSG